MSEIFIALSTFLNSFFATFDLSQYGLSIFDVVIVAVLIFYAYEGYSLGFTLASIDLGSFIISFLLALLFYAAVGSVLIAAFSLSQGLANAIGFFLIALVGEIIVNLVFRRVLLFIPKLRAEHSVSKFYERVRHPLGIFPGIVSAFLILSFLFSLLLTLPTAPFLKQQVLASKFGSAFVSNTSSFEQQLDTIFGGAVNESLNFLTIKPQSDETVNLRFTVENPTVDSSAEEKMLVLVNQERVKEGLNLLTMDSSLRELARDYSKDMLKRGYFAHNNPEGLTPFDRMDDYGISFGNAGENLALAPSVELAHQGLMNSPGHRANILSPSYSKIGIGVMDGGIYGKMFSQEFTD